MSIPTSRFSYRSPPHLLVFQLRALFVDEGNKRADEPQEVSGGHVVAYGRRVGRGVRRGLLHASDKIIGSVVAGKHTANLLSAWQ